MGALERFPIGVGILSVFSIAASVGFQFILLTRIGFGSQMDLFVISGSIAQVLSSLVLTIVPAVLVPVLSNLENSARLSTAVGIMTVLTSLLGIIAVGISLTAAYWGPVVFQIVQGDALANFVKLQGIQAISIPAAAITAVCGSVLHARGQFLRHAQILALFPALAALVLLLVQADLNISNAVWIQNFALVSQAFVIFLLVKWRQPLSRDRGSVMRIGMVWRKASPLLMGAAYTRTELLIDRHLLAQGNAGELAAFALVRQLLEAGAGLLARTHIATAVPSLSRAAAARDIRSFKATYLSSLWQIGWLSIALLLAVWVLMVVIVPLPGFLVREGGALDVPELVPMLGGVLIFAATGGLAANAFYALGDTQTPTLFAVAGFTLFMIAKIWVYPRYGISGLALATSAYFACNAAVLSFFLRRRLSRKVSE
jgi:putative peptidoglycan lipid II flippase